MNPINRMGSLTAQAGLYQVSRKQSKAASHGVMAVIHVALTKIGLLLNAQKGTVRLCNDHIA